MATIQFAHEIKKDFEKIAKFSRRDQFNTISDFLKNPDPFHICVLNGLLYSGKKTLALQAIYDHEKKYPNTSAIIHCTWNDAIYQLKTEIKKLYNQGIRILLINEITKTEDFIQNSIILSDIFSAMGMKIIVTGTDSFRFYLAAREGLFNRTISIPMTFLSFNEWIHLTVDTLPRLKSWDS